MPETSALLQGRGRAEPTRDAVIRTEPLVAGARRHARALRTAALVSAACVLCVSLGAQAPSKTNNGSITLPAAAPTRTVGDSLTPAELVRLLPAKLEVLLRRRANDRAGEATALNSVGMTFRALGRLDSADVYYRAALRIRREIGDTKGMAGTLNNIGLVFDIRGRRDSALTYYRLSLPLWRALGERWGEAMTLTNLGLMFDGLGQRDSALANFRAALPLHRAVANASGEAMTLGNIGLTYSGRGQRDSAAVYYRAAMDITQRLGDRGGEAVLRNNRGALFMALGQRDSAETEYRAALGGVRAVGDRDGEAATLNNLGLLFYERGELDSAAAYYRLTLPLRRAVGNQAGEAMALNNLGALFSERGRLDSAARYFRAALPLLRAAGDRAGEAATVNNLAGMFFALGQNDSVVPYYRAALALERAASDRSAESRTLASIGALFAHLGQRDAALQALRRASWLQSTVAASAPGDFLRVSSLEDVGQGVSSAWARLSLASSGDNAPRSDAFEAWGALERGRGQALRTLRGGGPIAEDSQAVTRVTAGARASLARLARPGRAFITYDSFHDSVLVLAVSPSGAHRTSLVPLPTDSLGRLIARVRALIGGRGLRRAAIGATLPVGVTRGAQEMEFELRAVSGAPTDSASLQALVRVLLPPSIREAVRGATELVVIPDGVLSLVPWAALPIDAAGTPLGVSAALRLAPSLSILDESNASVRSRARATRATLGDDALVVGDPAMPPGVPSLPGARAEARWVADTLLRGRRVMLLTGGAATATAVRARLAAAPLIHFATHAAAYPEARRARSSFLQFAATDASAASVLTVGELLDAAEHDHLRLRARLVVLSACETGSGALSATEGVLGLQRAFLALGAETLLVSLWKVDDGATRALMGAFYRHWLDDADAPGAAESLHRAQGDMRAGRVAGWQAAWARPDAWAAFQVVGAG